MKAKFDVKKHVLVPEQKKLNDKEKAALLEKYYISINNLPRILTKDKAISDLKVKEGDVIKVTRQSSTAGVIEFYRVVVNE
uniref:DNA-directed RNA polymerase subunit H (RpoH) n=1 Tax=uncultured marine group II/III euryarchaeote KM3_139_C07 TaxID=1457870 RepID=A0A075G9U4_9EURY|nr:DNA-directed RNA polymerase subunit H (rpoH) [uncultured marine group II/III euryarchaeote KM3_139_C07]